ncbi:MAG: hypothetical protein M0T77_00110 [Actinomycetota bacterium]|nr:hypothetical protein [Actinomycetota bacterium]
MRRCACLLISAVALGVLLAGCGGPGQPSHAANGASQPSNAPAKTPVGLLSGTLAVYGGVEITPKVLKAHPCGCWYYAGTVRLIAGNGERINIPVGKSGHFSRYVPTGRYTVIGGLKRPMEWPMGSCNRLVHSGRYDQMKHSFYIIVAKGQRVHVHVDCQAL